MSAVIFIRLTTLLKYSPALKSVDTLIPTCLVWGLFLVQKLYYIVVFVVYYVNKENSYLIKIIAYFNT